MTRKMMRMTEPPGPQPGGQQNWTETGGAAGRPNAVVIYSTTPPPAGARLENPRAWLDLWPDNHRSALANLFHYAARAGCTTPLAVLRQVHADLTHRLRGTPYAERVRFYCLVRNSLTLERKAALAYAQSVLDWEHLPYAERRQHKAERGAIYQQHAMAAKPVTEKQRALLQRLGVQAEPANRYEASVWIETALKKGAPHGE